MAALAALGPLVGHLPHHPLVHVVTNADILGIKPPGLLGDIHHHRPGLENADRLAPAERLVVHQGRHPVIGADAKKLVRELISLSDIARDHIVRHAALFQQNGDFLAVRGGPVM